eukprot:2338137-Amphidinium_carterae.1
MSPAQVALVQRTIFLACFLYGSLELEPGVPVRDWGMQSGGFINQVTILRDWTRILGADGMLLAAAPDALREDAHFVTIAVRQNGLALQHAAECIRMNKKVVQEALESSHCAWEHILDPQLKLETWDWLTTSQRKDAIQYGKQFWERCVCVDPSTLANAPIWLRDNKRMIRSAVQQHSAALAAATDELRADRAFILELVAQDGAVLEHAAE